MQLVLTDFPDTRQQLLPFTFTRPVSHIRCGIFTIAEKWQHYQKQAKLPEPTVLAEPYLQVQFTFAAAKGEKSFLYLDGGILPSEKGTRCNTANGPGRLLARRRPLAGVLRGTAV